MWTPPPNHLASPPVDVVWKRLQLPVANSLIILILYLIPNFQQFSFLFLTFDSLIIIIGTTVLFCLCSSYYLLERSILQGFPPRP